jgi:hypothetical protein
VPAALTLKQVHMRYLLTDSRLSAPELQRDLADAKAHVEQALQPRTVFAAPVISFVGGRLQTGSLLDQILSIIIVHDKNSFFVFYHDVPLFLRKTA